MNLSETNKLIVGEADNKNGEHVFVVQHVYRKSIDFMLYSNKYKAINNHPRIMATYNKSYDDDSYAKIEVNLTADIVMMGLGTKKYEADRNIRWFTVNIVVCLRDGMEIK